jgi:hypothetical protein
MSNMRNLGKHGGPRQDVMKRLMKPLDPSSDLSGRGYII